MKNFLCFLAVFISLAMCDVFCAEKNPACTSGSNIFILQPLLDNAALGFICPSVNWSYSSYQLACQLDGRLVYITPNNNYVDNQLVKIKRNECFAEGGVYQYINKNGDLKTVRIVEIINKYL